MKKKFIKFISEICNKTQIIYRHPEYTWIDISYHQIQNLADFMPRHVTAVSQTNIRFIFYEIAMERTYEQRVHFKVNKNKKNFIITNRRRQLKIF